MKFFFIFRGHGFYNNFLVIVFNDANVTIDVIWRKKIVSNDKKKKILR